MKSPKDILALGQAIVRELELDERGEVLERWLAHHLAELMSAADGEVGPAKAVAEQQAVDLILKLWMHRRALPEAVDPLGGYRNAIAVLGRLMPEADPWARYHRGGSYQGLLHEMFETLSRIVLGGVALTQVTRARSVSEAESKALAAEEKLLHEVLEGWLPFFALPAQRPEVRITFVDSDATQGMEDQDDSSEADSDALTLDQQAAQAEASAHSAILANLERMQTDLATLLARWRNAAPNRSELEAGEVTNASDGD